MTFVHELYSSQHKSPADQMHLIMYTKINYSHYIQEFAFRTILKKQASCFLAFIHIKCVVLI